jgi:AraC-like DNA-binding protein
MPSWDHSRAIESMRILADLAIEQGLSESEVLEGTGVNVRQLQSTDVVVGADQELKLIRNLVERLSHVPALGILAGQRYHFSSFGALGFALVSSPTLHDAMEIGLKYIQLTYAFSRFRLQEQGDHTRILISNDDIPDPLRQFVVERDTACFVTLQRELFSQVSPLDSLSFSFQSPADIGPYEAFYGVTPSFGKPVSEMVFNRHPLMQRMPQASELARRSAEKQCEQILNQRLARGGLSAKIRQMLASQAPEMSSMSQIASALNTIPRTLRRRLEAENTSFAALRDEVRQALAEEYLLVPKLSVEQVAERLGYSGPTSFINAYKRWYGVTPSARRARQ